MAKKPADTLPAYELRSIAGLTPYERNARTHSEAQVEQIAASIRAFGWTNPVLVDATGGIVAGHGRVLAAKRLGMAEVPVLVLGRLSVAQRRALVLADNKLALNAGWDEELLAVELVGLKDAGYDLGIIGFSDAELEGYLGQRGGGLTDEDASPEPPVNPVTVPGDIWLLGRHRVRCGDSTNASDVAALLGEVKPHLMVTDPPYGVEYDPAWRDEAAKHSPSMGNRKDTAKGVVRNDDRADWREAWALFPGDVAYVWHAGVMAGAVADSLVASGLEIRSQIVWAKSHLAIGRSHYHWQHEPCWYAVRKGGTGHWSGDRKQTTLWQIDKPQKSETGHSTQKPVECMRRPIENNSNHGQAVYDPFLGSGTTVIAAEQTGRAAFGMELSPAYVDVIVKRWQDFTGENARLEGDGRTFAEICDARYDPQADMRQSYTDVVAHKRKELVNARAKAEADAPQAD